MMPQCHSRPLLALLALLALGGSAATWAQTTVGVPATRDNTLYESTDGSLSNGAGNFLFAGRIQIGELRRALVAFEDFGQIPDHVQVTDVQLSLAMDRTVVGPVTVTAHAVTTAWGEGDSRADPPEGLGGVAESGDATWLHSSFDQTFWSTPGGDYDERSYAEGTVDQPDTYFLQGNQLLIDLVQGWLDGGTNHGLAILAESNLGTTAKRFLSRESGDGPTLFVTYVPREQAPPRVVNIAGLWFDEQLTGEGYNVIQSNGAVTIFYYGYDSAGNRLWLISETIETVVTTGETLAFTLFSGTPGTFDAPSSDLETWGSLELTVTDCSNARFELLGEDGGKVSAAMKLAGIDGNVCDDAGAQ